jgi:uncharacterized protein YwgA
VRRTRTLSREDMALAALAPAVGIPHSPVQVQKLLFLIDRNLSSLLGGPTFDFKPYHYGPFDRDVYATLEDLAKQGLVEITQGQGNWRDYRLTVEGQSRATRVLDDLDERAQRYVQRASDFVRSLTFPELVSAIYKAYPEMRVRSVFQE